MKALRWLFYGLSLCASFVACSDDYEPAESNNAVLFAGNGRTIVLQRGAADFTSASYVCRIKAADGSVFERSGEHVQLSNQNVLTLQTGLRQGVYRLLALKYKEVDAVTLDTTWAEYGLGCRVEVSESGRVTVVDPYDATFKLFGSGTPDAPYIISSGDHLKKLRNYVNDEEGNRNITRQTYFRQEADINMDRASFKSDHDQGWYPIGSQPTCPFRGVYDGGGHTIDSLWCKRPTSAGVGLFGFVEGAYIKRVKMVDPKMEGMYAVGSLVGGCVRAGDRADTTVISSCTTRQGYVLGSAGSIGTGGLVGVVDMDVALLMDSCYNEATPVSGDYAVGGLLGAGTLYSYTQVQQSVNRAAVSATHIGVGGIVGSVDSLYVLACSNSGAVTGAVGYSAAEKGAKSLGAGGIAGGAGVSAIYASENTGAVKGHTGVGGIIGSTRIDSEEEGLLFNNALFKGCANSGNVEGQTSVGGICGEAQFGGYQVLNKGNVTATASGSHVGGIVGNTSIAVVHNVVNSGTVTAKSCHSAGGILGKTTWGALFACQNYGNVNVSADYAGGVVGLAGNYTMVNYCGNLAKIQNSGAGPTGGVIGEIGDPRQWAAMDIVSCVIGGVESVMGVAGTMLAVAGSSIENATGGVALKLKTLTHVLRVPSMVKDGLFLGGDAGLLIYSWVGLATEGDVRLMKSSLQVKTEENVERVETAMNDIRKGYTWSAALMGNNLTTNVSSTYVDNTKQLLEFYEESDDNNAVVNYNINHKREQRYEKIQKSKRIQSIVQYSLASACCLASAVAGIAGLFVTAGTSAAVVVGSIAGIATTVGGINGIVQGATNYQNNVVVVSQCLNVGEIQAARAQNVGGVLGHAQQMCEVNDCLNTGPFSGDRSDRYVGGVVGRADAKSVVSNSLSVGKGWEGVVSYHGTAVSLKHLFYYGTESVASSCGTRLSLSQLCKTASYPGWSFSGTCPLWVVADTVGYFPMPNYSEMQEAVN